MKTRAFLFCGVWSALLYLLLNIVTPFGYPGYDPVSQTVSELSAVGAPTRGLWVWQALLYTALALAFGWGVWGAAGPNRRLRVTGALLIASAALGVIWPFAPMHQRAVLAAGGGTVSDVLHVTLGALTVGLFVATVGFGAAAAGPRFRWYSIATLVLLFVFGTLTGVNGPRIGRDLPTPWVGVWERIDIGAYLAWVVVLAMILVRRQRPLGRRAPAPLEQRVVGAGSGGFPPPRQSQPLERGAH